MQPTKCFKCCPIGKHTECQRQLGLIAPKDASCSAEKQPIAGSSIFLENIIDLSHTLAQIMILCGINECKAKMAIDIITYSLLNYDLVCYCLDTKPTKRLRKEDIFHEMGKKCLMNRIEAHLCYNIIKRGFKAFYTSQKDHELEQDAKDSKNTFSQVCLYVHAAKKTAEFYAQFDGLSSREQDEIQAKIQIVYKKFYDRCQLRRVKRAQENCCNCCCCAKSRGHLGQTLPEPCLEKAAKQPHTCSQCCKKKKSRKIKSGRRASSKCSICRRALKFCCCVKYQFDLNWIGSIWCRPDMYLYYLENIETVTKSSAESSYLKDCAADRNYCTKPEDAGGQVDVIDVVE